MNYTEQVINFLAKWGAVAVGAFIGILMPTIPFVLICIFALFLDSISAWRLAKRIKRNHPEIPANLIHDKYESEKAWNMFPTLLVIYGLVLLGHLLDMIMFPFMDMYLPNFIAGAFCFYEGWSVLENESSENSRSWAKFLQKFMVSKVDRHIGDIRDTIEDMKIEREMEEKKKRRTRRKRNEVRGEE